MITIGQSAEDSSSLSNGEKGAALVEVALLLSVMIAIATTSISQFGGDAREVFLLAAQTENAPLENFFNEETGEGAGSGIGGGWGE